MRSMIWRAVLKGCLLGCLPVLGWAAAPASGYTMVVGTPFVQGNQTGAQFYSDLLSRIENGDQGQLPVHRLLLSVENPQGNSVFDPANTSSVFIQFLNNLIAAKASGQYSSLANLEVYLLPDVESTSDWGDWMNVAPDQLPKNLPTTGACSYLTNPLSMPAYPEPDPNGMTPAVFSDMTKSVCLVQMFNQVISSPIIIGVAYDGQSNEFKYDPVGDPQAITWLKTVIHNSNLKWGWISGGYQTAPDLSLIEIYDQDRNHYTSVDTVAPESIYKVEATVLFPAVQKETSGGIGEVSPNVYEDVYQCMAAGPSPGEGPTQCYPYVDDANFQASRTPAENTLSAFTYIYTGSASAVLSPSIFSLPEPLPNEVVLLFSTQYIGPLGSYAGSGKQCNEAAGNCDCVASAYDPIASCGDEDGFGSWRWPASSGVKSAVEEFNAFVSAFVAEVCPTNGASCAAGIYKYDFIPSNWYTSSP